MRKALEHYGCTVSKTASGQEGIERLQAEIFDVTLPDLQMPGLTGHGFMRATETLPCRPPVLMTSGQAEPGDVVEGFRSRIAGFLLKPFTVQEVVSIVGKTLDRRHGKSTLSGALGTGPATAVEPRAVSGVNQPAPSAADLVPGLLSGKTPLTAPPPPAMYVPDLFRQPDLEAASLIRMLESDSACAASLLRVARMPRFVGAECTLVDLPGAVRRLRTRNSLLIIVDHKNCCARARPLHGRRGVGTLIRRDVENRDHDFC